MSTLLGMTGSEASARLSLLEELSAADSDDTVRTQDIELGNIKLVQSGCITDLREKLSLSHERIQDLLSESSVSLEKTHHLVREYGPKIGSAITKGRSAGGRLFTLAGSGEQGMVDGQMSSSSMSGPEATPIC